MDESLRDKRVLEAIKCKSKEILPEGSTVTLYGSRARGDFRPDSDWDIHILVPGPEKILLETIRKYAYPFELLGEEMGVEINPIVHSFEGWKKRWFLPLYHNIETEGILL